MSELPVKGVLEGWANCQQGFVGTVDGRCTYLSHMVSEQVGDYVVVRGTHRYKLGDRSIG